MRTSLRTLSTLAAGGGLALTLMGPAHAAVPATACDPSTTFAVSAGPEIDAGPVASLTEALEARGFTAAPASAADLAAVVAPASEIAATGSPSVMAVAIGADDLDPDSVTEGTDWVGITTDAKDAAHQLLDEACGPLPTPAPAPAEEPTSATPAQETTEETATPAVAAAPARPETETAPSTADDAGDTQAAAAGATDDAASRPAGSGTGATSGARSSGATRVADKNCGDFGSQAEAQDFFEGHGGPGSDEHRLDADGDGQACDTHFGSEGGDDAAATVAAAASTSIGDKDCGDFGSQAEAQTFFTGNGGPTSDRHRLDADDDGQACEDHFGGDNASRAEARTINAGTPGAGEISPAGLAGGALLVGAGITLGLRARRG